MDVDLKQTINLPRTTFSMKANLAQTEPRLLERWNSEVLYSQIRRKLAIRAEFIRWFRCRLLHGGEDGVGEAGGCGTAGDRKVDDYQMVSMLVAWIRRSLVTSGRPSALAVPAITRSGNSGTSLREIV